MTDTIIGSPPRPAEATLVVAASEQLDPAVLLKEFCKLAAKASETKISAWPTVGKQVTTKNGKRTVHTVKLALNSTIATKQVWSYWKDNKNLLKSAGATMSQRQTSTLPGWQASVWSPCDEKPTTD